MRPGVRVGVDVGSVRVGVATCDPAGLIATPVRTLSRGKGDLAERPAVVVGAAETDGKVALVAATNEAARAVGQSANAVLKAVLAQVDGRGGGKDDVAQGGGPKVAGLADALAAVETAVREARGA